MRPETGKLLHDIQSKVAGLKSAAELLRECSPDERKELLELMKTASLEITGCLEALGKSEF